MDPCESVDIPGPLTKEQKAPNAVGRLAETVRRRHHNNGTTTTSWLVHARNNQLVVYGPGRALSVVGCPDRGRPFCWPMSMDPFFRHSCHLYGTVQSPGRYDSKREKLLWIMYDDKQDARTKIPFMLSANWGGRKNNAPSDRDVVAVTGSSSSLSDNEKWWWRYHHRNQMKLCTGRR
jgi:hypothetical protein